MILGVVSDTHNRIANIEKIGEVAAIKPLKSCKSNLLVRNIVGPLKIINDKQTNNNPNCLNQTI